MLKQESQVVATYRVREKQNKLEARAQGIAVGLTVGSWTDLPATRQESVRKHCGRVEGIHVVGDADGGDVVAELSIGYPSINFTDTFASVLTTVFGKLSMDGEIRLVDLQIPEDLGRQFPGPKYGVAGLRERTGVFDRPLLMSIFKACVGRDIDDLSEHFRAQAEGGADFIKDDEIFFNESYATPEQRVVAYNEVARQIYEESGHKVAYAVNLTGPAHRLAERARTLSELGAGALLFNALAYGYDVLADIARDAGVTAPIMVHPSVSGALYGSSTHGMAANIVLGQWMRMAGADIVIYPSPYGSVTLDRMEGLRLVESLRKPGVHKEVMPAPSAGIFPGLVPQLVADFGTDCIVNAGGGIHGHPGGAPSGGQAFRAAIDATVRGVSLEEAAKSSVPLKEALEKWGTGR